MSIKTNDLVIDVIKYIRSTISDAEKPVVPKKNIFISSVDDLKSSPGVNILPEEEVWLRISRLSPLPPPSLNIFQKEWFVVSNDPAVLPLIKQEWMLSVELLEQIQAAVVVEKKEEEWAGWKEELNVTAYEKYCQSRPILTPPTLSKWNKTKIETAENKKKWDEFYVAQQQEKIEHDRWATIDLKASGKIKNSFEEYLLKWRAWSDEEKKRRACIELYNHFFTCYQDLKNDGGADQLEIVWGAGWMEWLPRPDWKLSHPLITQACELVLVESTHDIEVRPAMVNASINVSMLGELDIPVLGELREELRAIEGQEGWALNPHQRQSYLYILQKVAGKLDAKGTVYDASLPKTDRHDHLSIFDQWSVFIRRRPFHRLHNDLNKLEAQLSRPDVRVPDVVKTLVTREGGTIPDQPVVVFDGIEKDEQYLEMKRLGMNTTEIVTKNLFFPLPYNKEQVEIAKKLELNHGVVVQGPPGTGKSHTIANIICHYLAEGKKVLVTSHSADALSVIQEKIPGPLQHLCVGLLSSDADSMREFENAVIDIQERIAAFKPKESEQKIENLLKMIQEVRYNLEQHDDEIVRLAHHHFTPSAYISGGIKESTKTWVQLWERKKELKDELVVLQDEDIHHPQCWPSFHKLNALKDVVRQQIVQQQLKSSQPHQENASLEDDVKNDLKTWMSLLLYPMYNIGDFPPPEVLVQWGAARQAVFKWREEWEGEPMTSGIRPYQIFAWQELKKEWAGVWEEYQNEQEQMAHDKFKIHTSAIEQFIKMDRTGAGECLKFIRAVNYFIKDRQPLFSAMDWPEDILDSPDLLQWIDDRQEQEKPSFAQSLKLKFNKPLMEQIAQLKYKHQIIDQQIGWVNAARLVKALQQVRDIEKRWNQYARLSSLPLWSQAGARADEALLGQALWFKWVENVLAWGLEKEQQWKEKFSQITAKIAPHPMCDCEIESYQDIIDQILFAWQEGENLKKADEDMSVLVGPLLKWLKTQDGEHQVGTSMNGLLSTRCDQEECETIKKYQEIELSQEAGDWCELRSHFLSLTHNLETWEREEWVKWLQDYKRKYVKQYWRKEQDKDFELIKEVLRDFCKAGSPHVVHWWLSGQWEKVSLFCEKDYQTLLVEYHALSESLAPLLDLPAIDDVLEHRRQDIKRLSALYAELAAEKAWSSMIRSCSPQVRQALQKYLNAIKKIGAGTGKRAMRYTKEARLAMEEAYAGVPCWIMPQGRISESMPAETELFDLVIIDEASQSDIHALPALLRGKKVLVVGDDKQVSPVSIGIKEEDIEKAQKEHLRRIPYAQEMGPDKSIYDLFLVAFADTYVMLKEHFRCHPEIIQFSNRNFYNQRIVPLRWPNHKELIDPPLLDIFVNGGRYHNDVNEAEACVIAEEIENIVNHPGMAKKSIGVVTLISKEKQAMLIRQKINERVSQDKLMRHRISVGPPAIFQGKERDIIYISGTWDGDSSGPMNKPEFEQRFNVALSRARDQMILVRSVPDGMARPGGLMEKVLNHFIPPPEAPEVMIESLRPAQKRWYQKLKEKGYRVTPQFKINKEYSVDLLVESEGGSRLAIMCYDMGRALQFDAMLRHQRILERAGWEYFSIFETDDIFHMEKEDTRLWNMLENMNILPWKELNITPPLRKKEVMAPIFDGQVVTPASPGLNRFDGTLRENLSVCDSSFEREVVSWLHKNGYMICPQYQTSGYFVDIVVKNHTGRKVAIELDGDQYHGLDKYEDDVKRQKYLEKKEGLIFWRRFASDFYRNKNQFYQELTEFFEEHEIAPLQSISLEH